MVKNILITGGAQRIGQEIAIYFAKKGWNVVIHFNKSKKEAIAVEKKILSMGVQCTTIKADLSKFSEVKSIFKKTKKKNWNN